jgi:hypothetical protein
MKLYLKLSLDFAAAALLLASCNLSPATAPPPEDIVATSVHLTTTAIEATTQQAAVISSDTPSPSQTEEAPTEEPPAPTNTPESSPTPEPTDAPPTKEPLEDGRISFAPGTTFATVHDQIEENTTNEYLLNIQAGQMVSFLVESDGKTPTLALEEESGKEVLAASKGYTWYITTIQKTQDLSVQVISEDFSSDYILHVSTPINVAFDAGATSKTYDGKLEAQDIIEYKAYALKDQKAKVTLTSTSGQARLYIYGLSSFEEYVGYDENATTWEITLPESQTYLIKVLANDSATEYSLTIEFTN